ncbi:hypothetical protein BGZ97_009086, partial [Linnemannia gamsii]
QAGANGSPSKDDVTAAGFETENHKPVLHHHKKHAQGHKKDHRPNCEELSLKCNDKVIDKIMCKLTDWPVRVEVEVESESQSKQVFKSTNNDKNFKKNCKKSIIQRGISLPPPCSDKSDIVSLSSMPEEDEDEDDNDNNNDDNGGDEDDSGNKNEALEEVEGQTDLDPTREQDLWKHKKRRHRQCRNGDSHLHQDHRHYGKHKKNQNKKHPWRNLCVANGTFCGSNLFGCNFDRGYVYICDGHGTMPKRGEKCANG